MASQRSSRGSIVTRAEHRVDRERLRRQEVDAADVAELLTGVLGDLDDVEQRVAVEQRRRAERELLGDALALQLLGPAQEARALAALEQLGDPAGIRLDAGTEARDLGGDVERRPGAT